MRIAILLAVSAVILTACGADDAPERPKSSVTPGVSVSGDARIGVTGTL